MSKLTADNKLKEYICGRCGYAVLYKKNSEPPSRCTECGTKGTGNYVPGNAWKHGSEDEGDVPSSFKFNLHQFGS